MKKHFNLDASFSCDSCTKCYKCVKSCPVNAIKIKNDDVFELDELCIDCGQCYKICHKDVHITHFDPEKLDETLKNEKVIVLLDTTYFMSLNEFKINQLEESLIKAGFSVVETAFDGLTVHDFLVDKTFNESKKFYFNSNCIPFINYIKKFHPNLSNKLLPFKSATEISAILKKELYGDDYKILLVSNCFGDFNLMEDECPIDYVLLDSELKEFLRYKNISLSDIPAKDIKRKELKIQYFSSIAPSSISGMDTCNNIIDYASKSDIVVEEPLRFFVCSGGCFNSNVIKDDAMPFERELRYSKFLKENFIFEEITAESLDKLGDLNRFAVNNISQGVTLPQFSEYAISAILDGIGIHENMPEYDCNSCGYGSCREFAQAVLNDRANDRQCAAYINRLNEQQAEKMEKMIEELKEAFSLTIPDNRLEKKLKTTPAYAGVYDNTTDYIEITNVIDEGLYIHTINCLKLAADLKDYNVFDLIGIDKNVLVQTILYHSNAKTQPLLCKGDVVKYSDLFENKKEEAERSAIFAKKYYNVSDAVYYIIKYHKHDEIEIDAEFPRHLLYVFRLFKIIDSTSSVITKSEIDIDISFEFIDFILYIYKTKNGVKTKYSVDLYRQQDFKAFEKFLKE